MELTDVDFSFQNFCWLFENNETDQGHCLTAFGYFKEMNNFFYIWIAPGWLLWTVNFLSLTTDFEMSETYELLSWYLRGCIGHEMIFTLTGQCLKQLN